MEKKKGIIILAFGKPGYGYAAHNLAMSIKHFNKELDITLFIEEKIRGHLQTEIFFDTVINLPEHMIYNPEVGVDPAKVKIQLYSLFEQTDYDEALYLDVDGIAIKDVTGLIKELSKKRKGYQTEVRGVGSREDDINYQLWAKNEDVWKHYGISEDARYSAIQSSFCYIKKSKKTEAIFQEAQRLYNKKFPVNKLTMRWGGTIPDEMLFSSACAKLGYDPDSGLKPIFFGWKNLGNDYNSFKEKHYITAIYGNGNGRTMTQKDYIKWYDRLAGKYAHDWGIPNYYTSTHIMGDKHANN